MIYVNDTVNPMSKV